MKIGTRSVLFGVHQFIIHPVLVAWAWLILYRQWPRLHEWAAIITHDLGYWGSPNMDGDEGEEHPERIAAWWRRFGAFGNKVAVEILGHSRHHAGRHGMPLSRLFRPDKLSTTLYPIWLYLILGNLSGEIDEYMDRGRRGKYVEIARATQTQRLWLIEVQAHLAFMGLHGEKYTPVAEQLQRDEKLRNAA
ncbi:MAG: hypothetical protein OEV73_00230 [Desulfobulbaceae bacterium]|nr:hypothetical protein [Desulfobulbaceae bacterium]